MTRTAYLLLFVPMAFTSPALAQCIDLPETVFEWIKDDGDTAYFVRWPEISGNVIGEVTLSCKLKANDWSKLVVTRKICADTEVRWKEVSDKSCRILAVRGPGGRVPNPDNLLVSVVRTAP